MAWITFKKIKPSRIVDVKDAGNNLTIKRKHLLYIPQVDK